VIVTAPVTLLTAWSTLLYPVTPTPVITTWLPLTKSLGNWVVIVTVEPDSLALAMVNVSLLPLTATLPMSGSGVPAMPRMTSFEPVNTPATVVRASLWLVPSVPIGLL